MASRAIARSRRVVAYLPGLPAAVQHFRAFSSYDKRNPWQGPQNAWRFGFMGVSDESLGPFGPGNRRFPMPGMVGPSTHLQSPSDAQEELDFTPELQRDPDVLTKPLPSDRHVAVIDQAAHMSKQIAKDELIKDSKNSDSPKPTTDVLECVAMECPDIMKKDLQDLFPEQNLRAGKFTVITLSQRTDHDMSIWSVDVEEEREILLDNFVKAATDICESLSYAGFWADFIDPSSGKPYNGVHTNSTMFETDERYRHFGFEIDDLGCCKVIRHHRWGTKTYIGCLFTNAPLEHPVILDLTLSNMLSEWEGDDS